MAINEFVGEDGTAYASENYQNNGDFKATVYDAEDTDSINVSEEVELENKKRERRHKIKSDIFSLVSTAAINSIPLIIDSIKHRKDPTPYKCKKSDVFRLGASVILPAVQAFDTIALNCKIQDTIKEKTPFTFGDIRNVVNVIQAYPSTHTVLRNYFSNISRQANGEQQVIVDDTSKRDMFITMASTISPYLVDKMTDDRYSVMERFSSILPMKMFGGLVRKFVSTDPKLQHGYDLVTGCIRVADFSNNTFNKAIRSNNGMRNNQTNSFSTIIDAMQDITGMSRGNISRFNDGYYGGQGYDGWNNGSRFNNF